MISHSSNVHACIIHPKNPKICNIGLKIRKIQNELTVCCKWCIFVALSSTFIIHRCMYICGMCGECIHIFNKYNLLSQAVLVCKKFLNFFHL